MNHRSRMRTGSSMMIGCIVIELGLMAMCQVFMCNDLNILFDHVAHVCGYIIFTWFLRSQVSPFLAGQASAFALPGSTAVLSCMGLQPVFFDPVCIFCFLMRVFRWGFGV